MAERLIRLRYAGSCGSCAAALTPGTMAWWDSGTKSTTCETCHPAHAPVADDGRGRVIGVAGAGARRVHQQRKSNRERRTLAEHRYIGKVLLAVSEDPHHEVAWAKGAVGEEMLGERLNELADEGMWIFHDRRIPGSRANIDHMVVAPSGVWIIDAKRYKDKLVQCRGRDLYVGRNNKNELVDGMMKQTLAIVDVLGAEHTAVPIRPVLCFVDARFPRFSKPSEVGGVLVTWGKDVRHRIRNAPPVADVPTIGRLLEARLRAA